MGLDIRIPIGWMFTAVGGLLVLYGILTNGNAELYRRSLNINFNFWWGLVLLAFGLLMLIPALLKKEEPQSSQQPPPGQ
jgi:hypothetical protein